MSIVWVVEPEVEVFVIATQVVLVLPLLSSMRKVPAPQRSAKGASAVSTASVGTTNAGVAVAPSVTAMELGEKVIGLTVVVGRHGLVTVRV